MEPWKPYSFLLQHLYGTPASTSPLVSGCSSQPSLPAAQLSNYLLSGLTDTSLSPQYHGTPTTDLAVPPSIASKDSGIKVTLDEEDLWQKFHQLGTEMIVTRSGRRMFPILKVRIEGLEPQKKYCVMLTIVPMDEARYKFCNGRWAVSGRAEPHFPIRYFMHPDSPTTGKHWAEDGLVSFHRVKLTNNNKDQSGNMLLNSMHRYVPRIHIVEADDSTYSVQLSTLQTFSFPETAFFAVTAYQNENITQLKIDNNPFAKGFRDREKVFPQKRSAPFLEQLRKAASTEESNNTMLALESESECSPQKQERLSPTQPLINPVSLYNNSRLDLWMRHQRLQLVHPQQPNMTSHPFFSLALNKLPILNHTDSPFNFLPNPPGT